MISHRTLTRLIGSRIRTSGFSTKVELSQDPGKLVQGITAKDLENNSTLADYFNANCPTYGINTSQDEDLEQENSEGVMDLTPSNNIRSLHSYLREEEGSKKSVRLRQQDMIPGILYGSDPTQNILSTDNNSRILVKTPLFQLQRELDRFTYHNFESRVYDLTLYSNEEDTEGTIHRVLPKNVQFHPVQNKLYCVNYLRYHPGRPIKIPIVYINEEESPAMKRGGFIAPVTRHIRCIVEDGVRIPDYIEMDCTGLKLKDVIRMDRIIFPEGVRVSKTVNKQKFLVGTVFGRRSEVGDE
jgi:large subunit ribosomal protein L25